MTAVQRVMARVLSGTSDQNLRFEDLRRMLAALRFDERVRGSHHIFSRTGVAEMMTVSRGCK